MPETLMDLLDCDEDLVAALLPHVTDGPAGKMVHHPLVIDVMYREGKAALINRRYAFKVRMIDEALAARKYSQYLVLHERPYRLEALLEVLPEVGDRLYWPLVRGVWDDSENIYQHAGAWRELWEWGPEDLRGLVMDRAERAHLRSLPEVIPVWRGSRVAAGRVGMSWTTDREKAVWFANRWEGEGRVLEGRAPRASVMAYMAARGESEVVCLPEDVEVVGDAVVRKRLMGEEA